MHGYIGVRDSGSRVIESLRYTPFKELLLHQIGFAIVIGHHVGLDACSGFRGWILEAPHEANVWTKKTSHIEIASSLRILSIHMAQCRVSR